MEFALTEEQRILRDTLDRFMETGQRDTPMIERWKALAELGALGIGFTEDEGGLGGGPREMELVLEAAGQHRRTEPLIDALAIPGAALAKINPDRLAEIVSGDTMTIAAFAEENDPEGTAPRLQFRNGRLSGSKSLVPSGAGASQILVSALESDRLVLAEVTAHVADLQPMMGGQTGVRLQFQDTPATVLAEGAHAAEAINAGWRRGLHATCALALGTARSLFDETLAYVRVREQFGQPIGSFQVIQHRMADMMIAIEEARALIDMARHTLQSDGPDLELIMARTGVLERCALVGRAAIQLHGGIGMSEEMPLGRGFRNLKILQGRFGGEIHNWAALRKAL